MSGITGNIKSLLEIKFKTRHDSFTDQFHRIFMVKMMMVGSMLLGLNWFYDTITCVVPDSAGISSKFVEQACWIQGFYVFRDLPHSTERQMVSYYGIATKFGMDGTYQDGNLCKVKDQRGRIDDKCQPLKKTFYLQYQWFPFYVATLGFLYYLPYLMFRKANSDMISLKDCIKNEKPDPNAIITSYFDHNINSMPRMNARVLANLVVKIFYILSNVAAFLFTNKLLNGDFREFGIQWMKWTHLSNEEAYTYTANRDAPKPGEVLLPTFGICEVIELNKDVKYTVLNTHKFVCEISQHVMYHYVLIVLWWLFILGMVVSSVGFIMKVIDHVITVTCFLNQGHIARMVYNSLSLRECEYLEFIRKKNMPVYGEMIRKIKQLRLDHAPPYNEAYPMAHSPYQPCVSMLDEMKTNL